MRRFSRISLGLAFTVAACFVFLGAGSALLSTSETRVPEGVDPNGLVVHEWGTFTSVAASDGSAVEWIPQQGPTDLPCFVNRARWEAKAWIRALVRMETPVLYFYSPHDTTVDVRVRFRQGVMTEWYPRADVSPVLIKTEAMKQPDFTGEISWRAVRILPRALASFPTDSSRNHYYAARETDAAPVQVGTEREKFLFYRGIANFEPPLAATIAANGRVSVKAPAGHAIGDVVLFENRGGLTAHHRLRGNDAAAMFPALTPGRTSGSAPRDLENLLVAHGLYRREAKAMIETWRDSWFEEGTRLFYIVSQKTVDAVLPLEIVPAPSAVARVFVGRLELLTADTIDEVRTALAKRDMVGILKHGRFLDPIMTRIHPGPITAESRADWQFVYDAVKPQPRGCR